MTNIESRVRRTVGRGLVGLLGVIWLMSFVLHLSDLFADRVAWVPIYVETNGDTSPPIVNGFWSGGTMHDGLRIGDVIVGVGERSAPPNSSFDFIAQALDQSRDGVVAIRVQRKNTEALVNVSLEPRPLPFRVALVSAVYGLISVCILLLAVPSRASLLIAAAGFLYGANIANFFGKDGNTALAGLIVACTCAALYWPVFANGVQCMAGAPLSALERAFPWIMTLHGILMFADVTGMPYGSPYSRSLFLLAQPLSLGFWFWIFIRSYQRAGADERKQLRWIILGISLAAVPVATAAIFSVVVPKGLPLYSISLTFSIAVPLAGAIAILRAGLFNVDRAVGGAAAYALVAVGFALMVELVGEPLAGHAASSFGLPNKLGQVALVAILAIGAQPVASRLKAYLDRILLVEQPSDDPPMA
jgi:hypothetical protein